MPATPGRCSSRPAPRPPKKTAPAMLFATCVTCGRHSSAFPSKVLGLGCWVLGFATPQPQYPTPKTRAESALGALQHVVDRLIQRLVELLRVRAKLCLELLGRTLDRPADRLLQLGLADDHHRRSALVQQLADLLHVVAG